MTNRITRLLTPLFVTPLLVLALSGTPAQAEDYIPDDIIQLDISAEAFVVTQSANVSVSVNAAATDERAATLRAEMQKAVNDLAKPATGSEWRLTGFNRSQDQTGLMRWQATYESRVAESALAGINDRAQKASRAGMQLRIVNLDFTPTLAETEAKRSELRSQLNKQALQELAKVNADFPGRAYRIAALNYGAMGMPMMAHPMMMKASREMMMADSAAVSGAGASAEVAQRLTMTAQLMLGARPVK